jgi:hypothetical protein
MFMGTEAPENEVIETPAEPTEQVAEVSATSSPAVKELIDSISEPDPNAKPAEEPKPEDPKPETPPPDEESALIAEMGVKSERGQERVRNLIKERKQLEADLGEIRELVTSSGMTPDDFAQHLEFSRLVHVGDEKSLKVALQMVEAQRKHICMRLGIDAPGVDLLSDFPDLKSAVENMEMTPEHAAQLAKYRADEKQKAALQEVQRNNDAGLQAYQTQVTSFQDSALAFFKTKEVEADFPAKSKRMQEYFSKPENMQAFVSDFEPKQWLSQLRFMYDNMAVAAPQQMQQPMRTRPSVTGSPATSGMANIDRISAHLDSLGI